MAWRPLHNFVFCTSCGFTWILGPAHGHSIDPGYLRSHFSLMGQACFTHASRRDLLQISSAKELKQVESKNFFCCDPIPLEYYSAGGNNCPLHLAFLKSIKIWLFRLAWNLIGALPIGGPIHLLALEGQGLVQFLIKYNVGSQ